MFMGIRNITASFFFGDGSQLTNLPSGDNASWNESLASTLYADISVTGDNASWNESFANTLYRDIAWDNFTGIPHAAPSDGDTTHFSWADEIYDWAVGLFLSAMDYTNLAFTNETETFDENLIVIKNFTVNNTDFHVDTSAGRVGIGTTDPSEKLDVVGAIKASSTIYGNRADRFAFYTISGGIYASGSVDNYFAGNVGIGTTSPTHNLNVVGNANITGLIYGNGSQLTGDQNMSDNNITDVNCIIFGSGGKICSGV